MATLKAPLTSIMYYFRSPPKPSPKSQQSQHLSLHDDVEIASPPHRGVPRQTSSRDDTALHQRRHAPLEQQDHSSSSDHNEPLGTCSNSILSLNNSGLSSSNLHVHAAAPVSLAGLFHQQVNNHHGSGGKPSLAPPANSSSTSLPASQQQLLQGQTMDVFLLHPILRKIPLQFRFGFVGFLSNIFFMIVYNLAVFYFEQQFTPSTIYSIVYFLYIPIGHLMLSLLVFGWPEKYIQSLASNYPIGLTAMAIGSALTAYCDYKDFNNRIEEYIRDNFTFSHMPSRRDEAPSSEFYTSILVLVVTSVWTYVLSVYINASSTKSDKNKLL
ncbi:hypothetical protein MPSEU_000291300 [Mayamaea pseudoterrestris]|nr:hypothetical protein MPSEU_000291300 [Mayamaea pseudoterrestris]